MASTKYKYNFDNFSLLPHEGLLLQEGKFVPLSNRAFNVLFLLVKNYGKIVHKQEFLDEVWADTFVEEGNLAVAINTLRKILHTANNERHYIETFSRRGYRFNANVQKVLVDESNSQENTDLNLTKSIPVANNQTAKPSSKKLKLLQDLLSTFFSNVVDRKWLVVILAVSFLSYAFTANAFQRKFSVYSAEIVHAAKTTKIVVLPFVDLNPTGETKFLSSTISKSLTDELTQNSGISIVSSDKIAKFHQKILDPEEIRDEFESDFVLSGNYIKVDSEVSVTAKLIQVTTGQIIFKTDFKLTGELSNDFKADIFKQVCSKMISNTNQILSASSKKTSETKGLF